MKTAIKKLLIKKGWYYRVKYSLLFRGYQLLFKREHIRQERKELQFYRSFLPPCNLVFDIGANDGHKTQAFLSLGSRVVACEPDLENFALLQARFRHRKKRVELVPSAVTDSMGYVSLHTHHPGSAFNTISDKWKGLLEKDNQQRWNESIAFIGDQKVKSTTLDALIALYGTPEFIKLDVEGAEDSALAGLSKPISYLSFETLMPEYAAELNNIIAKLESLGRTVRYNIAHNDELLWPRFVNREELLNNIQHVSFPSGFEVIVNMSA